MSRFSIAGFELALEGAEPLAGWEAFAAPGASACLALKVELRGERVRPAGWEPKLPAIRASADGALTLEGDGFEAWIAADRREGWVRGPRERFPIEAVVRVLLADSLLRRGGLLVHGVALAHQGRAALFTGNSGAGKSTLGRWGVEGGLTLLADELVAVLPDDGGFSAHGTPWNAGGAGRAALKQVGVLAHAPIAELSPIAPSEVLRVLLGNVLNPGAGPQTRSALFQLASRLLAAVPSGRLAFAPDVKVAEVLIAALAAR